MQQYVRGLSEVGARVYGVGDTPKSSLPRDLARYLDAYLEVPKLLDEDAVLESTSRWLRGRPIDRVLSNWEPLIMLAARMRERWDVPGMRPHVAAGFRDKELMKQRVAAAGLRVPKSSRCATVSEMKAAAEFIGFPLIVKPIAGAGSADTYRVDSAAEFDRVVEVVRHVQQVSVEEFIDGREFTFDTVCVEGTPVFENVAEYLPRPLIARSVESISPVIITVRDMVQPHLAAGIELGRKVLDALEMHNGFTHMEWFLTERGEAVFGEIGARPGGAHLVDQMNYTCDIDLFREWARAVCWHAFEAPTVRRYNVGIIFKRARGQGRIQSIQGLSAFLAEAGPSVVAQELLPPGTPRRNWKNTLLSDGFIIVRHPDWDETRRLANLAAQNVIVNAG
ncbi:MAG: ATP-grasp domain-containing protein [Myxococcota bacterium]